MLSSGVRIPEAYPQPSGAVGFLRGVFMKRQKIKYILAKSVGYVMVAVLASCITLVLCIDTIQAGRSEKLVQLEKVILENFIGDVDKTTLEDGAAAGMVAATGDRWSYYISAADYENYVNQMENSYVGIGVTIMVLDDNTGMEIKKVSPGTGAEEAGLMSGDIITAVDGQSVTELGIQQAQDMIRGEENTQVELTILRNGETIQVSVMRRTIELEVASGKMLAGDIGLVTILNFDSRCAEETIAQVEALMQQGAKGFIFDVRNNPGGYRHELVRVLDYLLPEGELFRSVDYQGKESVDTSDANCVELPMAVLMNGESYSAAEFFAAALEEYDWAVTVGNPTVGKGYFQNLVQLSDGSAVSLSMGKYFTPKGVSLAEVGGLTPNIPVEVTEEQAAAIMAGTLAVEEDPQIQAALKYLTNP